MNYKFFLFNINSLIFLYILSTSFLLVNKIFFLCLIFFTIINLKDIFYRIVILDKIKLLKFFLILFISFIEMNKLHSNYSLLLFIGVFKNHSRINLSYLKYNLKKHNINENYNFILINKLSHSLFYDKNKVIISPEFSGVITDTKIPIHVLSKYLNLSNKNIKDLNINDIEILKILNY